MRALNSEGQLLIDNSKIRSANNLFGSVITICESLDAIRSDDIEDAKERIFKVLELIFNARRVSIIIVRGLTSLVINERCDTQNHILLTEIYNLLQYVLSIFLRLPPESYYGVNVISYRAFQLRRIIKNLSDVLRVLTYYKNINVGI